MISAYILQYTIHYISIYKKKYGIINLVYATLKLTTPLQTNMDTQDDGLENASPFEYGHIWPFLVSMLNLCQIVKGIHARL